MKQLEKQRRLEVLGNRIEGMTDRNCRGSHTNFNHDRLVQNIVSQMPDLFGHGSRKEQGLPSLRQLSQDLTDIGQKAHVKHMVGLIEDQHLQSREIDRLLSDMVEETPRTGHHNLGAAFQFIHLGIEAHSAIDGYAPEAGISPQNADCLMYLLSQFPSRGNDECTDVATSALHQAMQDREREGSGLAGAGLRQTHNIMPLHDQRDRLGLDRRRRCITRGLDPGRDMGVKIKYFKFHKLLFFCVRAKKNPGVFRGLLTM